MHLHTGGRTRQLCAGAAATEPVQGGIKMAPYQIVRRARPSCAARLGAAALFSRSRPAPRAEDQGPIKIGVIAEAQAVAGSSIPSAAQIAADEINAQGRRRRPQDRDRLLRQPFVLGRIGARLPARRQRGPRQCGHRELYQRSRAGAGALGGAAEDGDDHAGRRFGRHHREYRQGLRAQQIHLPRLSDLGRAVRTRLRRRQGHAGRRPQDEEPR